MRIKEITEQMRRDFWAIYECEHCDYESPSAQSGYDDEYYHNAVIPHKYCPSCLKNRAGETKEESGVDEKCVHIEEKANG